MTTVAELMAEGTAFYNKGDMEGYCSLYSDDVVLTTPDGRYEGRDGVLAYMRAVSRSFPDSQVTIGRRCDAGDVGFDEFTVRGTNTGPISMPDGSELPATHRAVHLVGMEVAEVRGGKIVQHDMVWDTMSVLQQLGLAPSS